MGHRLTLVALLVALAALPAAAQEGQPAVTAPTPREPGSSAPPVVGAPTGQVDVNRLPLDLERLEQQLRRSTETERRDGLRLEYNIQVFGRAPRLQFFTPEDVRPTGPVPYGAPTHREMLDVMTPKEYRAPAADFGSFMRWLNDKLNK